MSEFIITELDDRLEFGLAVMDDDVFDTFTKCNNQGNCCGDNPGCTNKNCGVSCCS